MKESEAKLASYMQGSDNRLIIPVYQRTTEEYVELGGDTSWQEWRIVHQKSSFSMIGTRTASWI